MGKVVFRSVCKRYPGEKRYSVAFEIPSSAPAAHLESGIDFARRTVFQTGIPFNVNIVPDPQPSYITFNVFPRRSNCSISFPKAPRFTHTSIAPGAFLRGRSNYFPPLFVYMFAQRYFVEGIERTGLVE
jgi:hypothetical protein